MSKEGSHGVGILGVLLIVFIVLKLLNLIDWSWLVVLIPLWISIGMFIIELLFILIGILLKRK